MKVAFVVQRYGAAVTGGAEHLAQAVAEQLVKRRGWQVEVFTTTATDYTTWRDSFAGGTTEENGVTVHRYPPRCRFLHRLFWRFDALLCGMPSCCRRRLERFWFILQGPYVPALIRDLARRQAEFRRIFFFTYRFYPTVAGVLTVTDRAVIIPCAHDEPALRFAPSLAALSGARALLANSEAEKRLLVRNTGVPADRIAVVGMGIEPEAKMTGSELPAPGTYLLYMGRISAGKGVDRLVRAFLAWRDSPNARPIDLILTGTPDGSFSLPDDSRIRALGDLAPDRRQGLLCGAAGLVNPSAFESLSIIVLQAMQARVPVLVNARSEVLRDYANVSGSVLLFDSDESLLAGLERLLATDWTRKRSELAKAAAWVRKTYSWDRVLDAYENAAR